MPYDDMQHSSTVTFYEDDYCQIEILPAENLCFNGQQAGVSRFAEEHCSGVGVADVFMLQKERIPLFLKKISILQLELALAPVLKKVDDVLYSYDYSSSSEKCKATGAFSLNRNLTVFYDFEGSFVKNIWLDLQPETQTEVDIAMSALGALSSLGDLIIVDWGWNFVCDASDANCVRNYLNDRHEVFSRNRKLSARQPLLHHLRRFKAVLHKLLFGR